MSKQIIIKQMASYKGHQVTANGVVNLNLQAKYSELVHSVELLQALNNDIMLKIKLPGEKPVKVGIFRIKNIIMAGDGESTIKLAGITDFVNLDCLNLMPMNESEIKEFLVRYEATIEIEEEEGENE